MEIRRDGDIATAVIPARLDGSSAADAETGLKELAAGAPRLIVCDFSGTEYVSSAGMRVLLSTGKLLSRTGGKVVLCGLRPPVKKVFEIAGFTQVFRTADSCGKAKEL